MHTCLLHLCVLRMKGDEGERVRGGALGLGPLVGGATFSYGYGCGCTKAEILAINDDGEWRVHRRRHTHKGWAQCVCSGRALPVL